MNLKMVAICAILCRNNIVREGYMILALDLGTRTGWAVMDDQGKVHSGYKDFKGTRYEGGGMRYLKFQQWLGDVSSRFTTVPSVVVYEEVRRHLGTDAAHVYGGLLAVLTSWCEQNKIPYKGYGVGTIKKFATGKGNADKKQMIEAARSKGLDVSDDNQADAWWILQLYLQEIHHETTQQQTNT